MKLQLLLLPLAIASSIAGCRKPSVERLEEALKPGSFAKIEDLSDLCKKLGTAGENRIRLAITASTDARKTKDLVRALLSCNVNANLEFCIKAVVRAKVFYDVILEPLMGRLDQESERIIEQLLHECRGREFHIAAQAYGLISDSPKALIIAKAKLNAVDHQDMDEVIGALTLLRAAAFHNGDESAADLFLPYLENSEHKPYALLELIGVPGARAEELFLDFARRGPGQVAEDLIQRHLQMRQRLLGMQRRPAPGWSKEALSQNIK